LILIFHFNGVDRISIKKKELSEIINLIIKKRGYLAGKIEVIFTTDEGLKRINSLYLNHNYYTDIITFGDIKKETINGELYISLERIRLNSLKYSGNILDKELYRVIIHGILHLTGFNDSTLNEKKQMTQLEDYYLNELTLQIGKK
jgi:probable rRNA maturation factor